MKAGDIRVFGGVPGDRSIGLPGGLVGFILQQVQCMAGDPVHLMASHGLLGLLVAGFFVGGSLLRR